MVKENGAWKAITWDDAITRLEPDARAIEGDGRERGLPQPARERQLPALPRRAGSPRYGMPAHLSVDFEADSAAIEANRRTYGVAWPSLSFKDAKLIVSFGADFLDGWGASVPQQLDFADARAKLDGAPRFVYIGPRRSLTGLNADEWIACKPGSELAIANALAGKGSIQQAATDSGVDAATLQRLADELAASKPALVALRRERRRRARRRARRRRDQRRRSAPSARRSSRREPITVVRRHRARRATCSPPSSGCARGQVGIAFVRGTNPAYSLPEGRQVRRGVREGRRSR